MLSLPFCVTQFAIHTYPDNSNNFNKSCIQQLKSRASALVSEAFEVVFIGLNRDRQHERQALFPHCIHFWYDRYTCYKWVPAIYKTNSFSYSTCTYFRSIINSRCVSHEAQKKIDAVSLTYKVYYGIFPLSCNNSIFFQVPFMSTLLSCLYLDVPAVQDYHTSLHLKR